jgi:HSP20 family molecular chaperone IbpA
LASSSIRSETSPAQGSGWNVAAACIQPLYNLFVTAKEVVLTIDLPYVEERSVNLKRSTEDSIEVYAETNRKITFKDLGMKHRRGEFTCYHAIIRMPVAVNERKITKKFKRGLLEVHIPRMK